MTDNELREFLPKSTLTEEELNAAKGLNCLEAVKYINKAHPDLGLKLSKLYYELYLDKDA